MRTLLTLLAPLIMGATYSGSISSQYEVCYSPKGGCTGMIVDFIDKSTTDIKVLAYVFTSDRIADALTVAVKRGHKVQVVLDKNAANIKGNDISKLVDGGVEVWLDKKHPISHSKVIIIGDDLETGSFNFSNAAEIANQENALILRSTSELANHYRDFFESHRSHSVSLK